MQTAVKGAADTDKIKMNAVRAIGNLLQLIKADLITEEEFIHIISDGLSALTRNCISGSNMKVATAQFCKR